MAVITQRNFCVYVTGFPEDTDRATLKSEFSKFGKVEKLFLENTGKFAKVFYNNKRSCDNAIQELNNTILHWQVQYFTSSKDLDNASHISSSTVASTASKMAGYRRDTYDDDEDFSESYDYCNVHGQPLTVLQADTGDLYVNLKDIRRTGFALFRKDTFDPILIDKRQIGKEFELHLLSEAKNYILKNKVSVIHEEDILKTIERCKNKLLGESTPHESRSNFGPGRSVAATKNNFVITASASSSPSPANLPTSGNIQNQRPPKTLPNNFMPFNRNNDRNNRSRSQERGPKNNQYNNTNRHNDTKQNNNFNNSNRQRQFVNGFETNTPKKESTESNDNTFSEPQPRLQPDVKRSKPTTDRNMEEKRFVKEEIAKLALEIGSTYDVQVVYIEDKENICWVQKKEDADAIEDILLQLNEKEEELEIITKPAVGQLVLAQFEGAWSRGRVYTLNPLTVHFIDYGNKSEVESVKPLLDNFKKIPALAARIKINKTHDLNSDMIELTIKVRQQYDDGTYLVNLLNSVSSSSENENSFTQTETKKPDDVKEKCYLEIPKPIAELKHGDKVMVIDMEGNKFLVRTKECAQKCKEITDYIKNVDKSALSLQNVKIGQLVLSSKDGLVGLYRAVVTKKDNAFVTVKYVDFSGEDDLSIKSLRNVDTFLAQEPSCILLTPAHQGIKDVDDKVSEYIEELCQNKEKFTVILSDGNFDLQHEGGKLLSETLSELRNRKPKPAKQQPPPEVKEEVKVVPKKTKSTDKITYDDMDWITVEPGSHSFLCYRFKDIDDMTMIDSREEVISYVEEITGLEVTDDGPYTPEELEMCLVLYRSPDEEDDASWCRATVLSVEDDGCEVSFVDFGNKEKVNFKDIRKFPPNLKDIPMLGIDCELIGLPNTPEILKYLKELLPEGDQVDVIIKGLSGTAYHKYQIEIPAVYKLLQAKGLY